MKFFILLVVLVFGFGVKTQVLRVALTVSTGFDEVSKIVGPVDYTRSCINRDSSNKERVLNYARKYGNGLNDNEEAVTNKNNLIEPCSEGDYDCMREFMANNSQCKPACGPVPDPLYLAQTTVFFAYSNMTLTYTNYTTTGLKNTTIRSFFYNKVTEDLVIVMKVPVLIFKVPKLYITYKKPGKESVVKSDMAYVTFKSLIFTAVIPKIGILRLDLADIKYGYSEERCPDFYIGPAAYTSKDSTVTAAYAEFLANVPLGVRDVFLFHSELLAALYIQKFICDFNLNLYSV